MDEAKPSYAAGVDLESLWQAVAATPEDPGAHERFINFAVLAGRHREAIERYQSLGESSPTHKDLAEKKKVAIAMRVAANLMANAPRSTIDRGRARNAAALMVLGVLMLLAALVGASAYSRLGWLGIFVAAYGVVEARRASG